MSKSSDYEDSIVMYFAEVLSSKTNMSIADALESVEECIREELASGRVRLRNINLPLGDYVLGRTAPSNPALASYIQEVLAVERSRWHRNGVTDHDIKQWWDLGGVMHGCYVAFDNLFNGAQVIEAMQNPQGFNSLEEAAAFGKWSLAKRFALFGPAHVDDGTENGRLPQELRARVESWVIRARNEFPEKLLEAIDSFESFNALCRTMIRQGVM